MKNFTALSTFSGAMGLDLGLEGVGRLIGNDLGKVRARFEIVACIEKEETFLRTIRKSVEKKRTKNSDIKIYGNIEDIQDPAKILSDCGISEELDLLVGGPPCQSYSTVGRRGTIQDPRGSIMWEFIRFIETLRPKVFLMENVRGLMSSAIHHRPIKERGKDNPPLSENEKPGSVYRLLLSDFESLGYHVDVYEVNAVNYGAPQLRERVLFIGNRFNKIIHFPKPRYTQIDPSIDREKLGSLDGTLKPFRTLKDAIGDLIEEKPEVLDFSPRKKKYLALVPEGGNWRSLPEEIQKESMGRAWYAKGGRSGWWRRLSWDLPSPCILTIPSHASTSLCHPTETRALSLRECARIQEFSDDWEFLGTTQEKYTQVGNAVPLRLGEVAGKVIGDFLLTMNNDSSVNPGDPVLPHRKIYLKSHIRTRKWYYKGKAIIRNNHL